ncbi:MAG: serine/threonine-protein kinase [Chitinophagaceae bacterium]
MRVYDFGDSELGLFIAMEYVDGGSLRDHLRRLQRLQKYLPLAQCLQIGIQIAEALDYAHRRKIIHRDVKPGNIILKRLSRPDEAGAQPFRALLTDFGLVKLQEGTSLTQSGATVGTPTYMSPEQCEGRELDGRSDLYSLGIVLYELVANKLPFTFQTLSEAIAAHQQQRAAGPGQPVAARSAAHHRFAADAGNGQVARPALRHRGGDGRRPAQRLRRSGGVADAGHAPSGVGHPRPGGRAAGRF